MDDSRIKIWKHVDITYKTRMWLIYKYLSGDIDCIKKYINYYPFYFPNRCKKEECLSNNFLIEKNMNYLKRYEISNYCIGCIKPINN